jgi:hypothetical protein
MGEAEKKQNLEEERSAAPPGWPNMPGRSAEHDANPPTQREGSSESTELQRELERHPPKR